MIVEKSTEKTIKLYYDLYVPDGVDSNRAAPLLIALHGYEGTKESMMAMAQKVNPRDFIIASIQAPNAFFVPAIADDSREPRRVGFGWMLSYKPQESLRLHHQTILSVIAETESERRIDRRRIFLMGFSQSVAMNYRFTFSYPDLIRGVVAICGGIPGDWDQDKYHKSDTDVLIIAGESDEFYPKERTATFKETIARRARSVEYSLYPVGHVFPRESVGQINEWLLSRCDFASQTR